MDPVKRGPPPRHVARCLGAGMTAAKWFNLIGRRSNAAFWRNLRRNAGAVSLDTRRATANIGAMNAALPHLSDASGTASTTHASVLARLLALQRPLVMGILNVTPDSFSDGGAFLSPDAAVAHAEQMITEGADIIDIGGESTRPSPNRVAVSADEELRRLEFVLPAAVRVARPVSIDTMKATVAAWAHDHGAAK